MRIFSTVGILLSFIVSFGSTPNLTTPRASVRNLFDNIGLEKRDVEVASKSLYNLGKGQKNQEELARKLVQIFRGRGIQIVYEDITVDKNFVNEVTSAPEVVLDSSLHSLYLKKYGDKWLIKKESVKKIASLYKSTYPLGTHRLLNGLSRFTKNSDYKALRTYQFLGLLILIFLCYLVHRVLFLVFEKVILRVLYKIGDIKVVSDYVGPIIQPFSLLIVVYVLVLFVPVLQFDVAISRYLLMLINASVPLFFTVIAYKFVDVVGYYLSKLAEKTETNLDDQLVPLFRKTLKVFVSLVGVLFILQNLSFNVTALLAGLSIGGLAFALAAQDMIKNLFGSVMIFIDRPFQIGDWVSGTDLDGTVEEVGFRSTRIRTFYNSVVAVPNGKIADMTIDNMGVREYRRYKTYLALTYDTPTDKIELFVSQLNDLVATHWSTRKDYHHIYFNAFNESSLDILFYIFFEVKDWGEELKARHEVNLEIMKIAGQIGVSFAFKTQTLHIASSPEKDN